MSCHVIISTVAGGTDLLVLSEYISSNVGILGNLTWLIEAHLSGSCWARISWPLYLNMHRWIFTRFKERVFSELGNLTLTGEYASHICHFLSAELDGLYIATVSHGLRHVLSERLECQCVLLLLQRCLSLLRRSAINWSNRSELAGIGHHAFATHLNRLLVPSLSWYLGRPLEDANQVFAS